MKIYKCFMPTKLFIYYVFSWLKNFYTNETKYLINILLNECHNFGIPVLLSTVKSFRNEIFACALIKVSLRRFVPHAEAQTGPFSEFCELIAGWFNSFLTGTYAQPVGRTNEQSKQSHG